MCSIVIPEQRWRPSIITRLDKTESVVMVTLNINKYRIKK